MHIDIEKIRAGVQDPMLKVYEFNRIKDQAVDLMMMGEMRLGAELLALKWEDTEAYKHRELANTLPTRKELGKPEVFIQAVRDAGVYAVAHRMKGKVSFVESRVEYIKGEV